MKTHVLAALLVAMSASSFSQVPFGPNGPNTTVWSAAVGGNGHAYEPVARPVYITWQDAQQAALNAGGTLATITSAAENAFVFSLINLPMYWASTNNNFGPWLGGFQPSFVQEPPPTAGWTWVTGEAFGFSAWDPGQPDDYAGCYPEDFLQFWSPNPSIRSPNWNDFSPGPCSPGYVLSYVVEYDLTLACPPPSGSSFTLCAAHTPSGAARLQIFNLPAGAAHGRTLISTTPAFPPGAGPFFGLQPDSLTTAIAFAPERPGDPLSWTSGQPGLFPLSPYFFPAGVLTPFTGQTWDLVAVAATASGAVSVSNVIEVTW